MGSAAEAAAESRAEARWEFSNAEAMELGAAWLWKGVADERRRIAVPLGRPSRRSLEKKNVSKKKGCGDDGRGRRGNEGDEVQGDEDKRARTMEEKGGGCI